MPFTAILPKGPASKISGGEAASGPVMAGVGSADETAGGGRLFVWAEAAAWAGAATVTGPAAVDAAAGFGEAASCPSARSGRMTVRISAAIGATHCPGLDTHLRNRPMNSPSFLVSGCSFFGFRLLA